MSAAESARLVASLTLDASAFLVGAKKVTKASTDMQRGMSNLGKHARSGVSTAGKAIAGLGVVAAGAIAVNVKAGIDSLATLESAVTSVDGAIAQMGQTGQVSGAQIADWANGIEANIGAAFDDKDITAATATLIRFGKLTPANLRPAMEVMTDLAAKTGSVDSAATLLAKALADPEKAAGKLARQGVILTKGEQKQIKAFMAAGKVGKAQEVILDSLAKTTKGAAAATQGPYQRAMSTLADVTEDAQRALAEGFLPVLQRAADWLRTKLADPATLTKIRSFGQGLANAFDKAIDFAQKIPWGTIGDGLEKAAGFAKGLFDAFRSMPPEVQATLVALAGLNKISGGAISGIVGELGKGLIKGVLGMTAGVVNINAGVVKGPGGLPTPGGGTPPVVGAGGAAAGGLATTFIAAASVTALAGATALALYQVVPRLLPTKPEGNVDPTARDTTNLLGRWIQGVTPNLQTIDTATSKTIPKAFEGKIAALQATETQDAAAAKAAIESAAVSANYGFRAGERATYSGAQTVAGAVRASRPIVTTNVTVNVTPAQVSKSVNVQARYGSSNGSAGSGPGGAPSDVW